MFRIDDLRHIRVPVIPFGVGTTQSSARTTGSARRPSSSSGGIHGSCSLASVRDPRSAEALAEAGIQNVAMTGCPTLFRGLARDWRLRTGKGARRVDVTSRDGQRKNAKVLLARPCARRGSSR